MSTFDLRFEPAATCPYLRYLVSYTIIKLWQITYEDNFISVKIYIALNSEMRIKTQFKKNFNQLHQIQYIDKNISVAACRLE